jgi:hypothetical protein
MRLTGKLLLYDIPNPKVRIVLAHILTNLIAQIAYDEDHFLQLGQCNHRIQEMTQHGLACEGNQGFRFRPGVWAKPRSKPRHGKD